MLYSFNNIGDFMGFMDLFKDNSQKPTMSDQEIKAHGYHVQTAAEALPKDAEALTKMTSNQAYSKPEVKAAASEILKSDKPLNLDNIKDLSPEYARAAQTLAGYVASHSDWHPEQSNPNHGSATASPVQGQNAGRSGP